ncbi:hypothetical protein FD755_009024 [Muntiacus reevesi]|uniref:RING-type E3 ubiquitin transferase n=1 Tax=Muntiacus reevesi TaxID=9886 RepID=A0A5J5MM29_MUNRE|nr:hypothetical protein FD755_009024 [Muntiacus reevesi]
MHGVCKEGDNCHYSHALSNSPCGIVCPHFQGGYPLLLPGSIPCLLSSVGPTVEMNMGKAESRNSNFATVGAGQPYCGRTASSSTEAPLQGSVTKEDLEKEQSTVETKKQLLPYASVGDCHYGENCAYLHGNACDMCELKVLHSMDAAQSKDMVCGICMEVVYKKANPSEHCIGILSNHNHTYCLKSICKSLKSCPECWITSNFVISGEYWVEEKEEKQKLIQKYKEAMSHKAGRYFDEGRGNCPFEGNCFYKLVYPDGRREESQRQKVGTASRHRAQQRNHFWELIEEQENGNPFDNEEEVVTFELGKMLLVLLAAGGDDALTDSEEEQDLFHNELEDFYDLDL